MRGRRCNSRGCGAGAVLGTVAGFGGWRVGRRGFGWVDGEVRGRVGPLKRRDEFGWVDGEVIGRHCGEVGWDAGVLQARCQTSRAGGAAPGGPTAEEVRVVRETSTCHQEATVSACCTTPCVLGFNTGASAKGVGSAGRAPRCEGAPLMRGVDGVETLRDALASEKAEARRDVNLPRGWLGPDAGLGCRAEERRGNGWLAR